MSEIITNYTHGNYIDAYDYDKILEILREPDDGAHIALSKAFNMMSDRKMDIYFEEGEFRGTYLKRDSMFHYENYKDMYKDIRIIEYGIRYDENDEHIRFRYIPADGDPFKMKGRTFTIRPDYKPYGGRDGYRHGGY